MRSITASYRIALSLAALAVSIVLSAQFVGLIPNEHDLHMRGRSQLCESIAINLSLMARRSDTESMHASLKAIVNRNPQIKSIGVRRDTGDFQFQVGDHARNWQGAERGVSTETHMYVPISENNKPWGTVEVCFASLHGAGLRWWVSQPILQICGFVGIASFFGYLFYLRRILNVLNPSKVIPNRVRSALDSLAEGLLVLDKGGRIVLANNSFVTTTGKSQESLLGLSIDKMDWVRKANQESSDQESVSESRTDGTPATPVVSPWAQALTSGTARRGDLYEMAGVDGRQRTFAVSAAPICDDTGKLRGAITSFEDVTRLERKKDELTRTLTSLRKSSETIREQNRHLEHLATRDPLTGCLNRRSLFEQFEVHWSQAARYDKPLSCIMVDIDHFKSVNDTHGHQMGDQVLQKVGELLIDSARDCDIVARYGGEEFAIVCPETDIVAAHMLAERLRKSIAALDFPNLRLTASLGVASRAENAPNPQGLVEQADQSLYAAKRAGRNQVVRFDQGVADDNDYNAKSPAREAAAAPPGTLAAAIPYPAVTALISALNYRDPDTAAHCRRVADLCSAVGHGISSLESNYVLEMAALLHDIGKIGVPDAILRKPTELTADEWQVMRRHESIGLEIVNSSFASPELSAILNNYRLPFNNGQEGGVALTGSRIPVGARILSIADAYDSMTSDQVYRCGRSQAEAFAELRKHAGTQFDSELVERFIEAVVIRARGMSRVRVSVSKETALTIGSLIERLAVAVDRQDLPSLAKLSGQLAETANQYQAPEIAAKAMELEQAVAQKKDTFSILCSASELFEYCRASQASYLTKDSPLATTH